MKIAAGLLCSAALGLLASARVDASDHHRYLFEAESLAANPASASYGVSFAEAGNTVGGCVLVQAKKRVAGSFVPEDEPVRLIVPAGTLPAGRYRISLRVLRWSATADQEQVPSLRIAVGNVTYDHRFQGADSMLTVAGGVFSGKAIWQWIEMPTPIEVGEDRVTIDLTVTQGTGNYLGVMVDAVKWEAQASLPVRDQSQKPQADTLVSPKDVWRGDVVGSNQPTPLPGASQFSILANDQATSNDIRATYSAPPADHRRDLLIGWVRCELPVKEASIRFSDGRRKSAELPLTRFVHAEPIRAGYWYLGWMDAASSELANLDRRRECRVELKVSPLNDGVRLAVSDWRWAARNEVEGWADNRAALSPSPAVQQELVVASRLMNWRREKVDSHAKLILWPNVGLTGGGPDTRFMRDHAPAVKRAGVDGVIVTVNLAKPGGNIYLPDDVFSTNRYDRADFEAAADDVLHADWDGLRESLIRINVVPGICWFDESAWALAREKTRCHARLVKLGKLWGILLDTEQYGGTAFFEYPQQQDAAQHSFDEFAKQAFQRGRAFAEVCHQEMPGLLILITHGVSELVFGVDPPYSQTNTRGSLLPAFVDGMLSVNGPTIVDGFESSYYHRTPRDFLEGSWRMDEAAKFSRDPERYRKRMKKGFGVWTEAGRPWNSTDETANYFSPVNLENALHAALRCSDGYVWLYTETLNWVRMPITNRPNHQVPSAAYDKAITASRDPHDPLWLPTPGRKP